MVSEGPRHATVTPDDHGAILQIAAWFLMVLMILSIVLRLTIRLTTTHIPGIDDAVVFVAMLFGVAGTIAISLAVNNGLGRRLAHLDRTQISGLEKCVYASTILYLLTLSLAKASTLITIARLTGHKTSLDKVRVTGAVVLLWSVASIFAVAFQCRLPRPWDYLGGRCFDPIPFWDTIAAVDILTDVIVIALPTWIIWTLQMSHGKKIIIFFVFAFRLVVIAAAITRLIFLKRLHVSVDPTFDSIAYSISTQCQATFSVIAACIPTLKPFMDRAESGMLNVSLKSRPTGGTYGYQGSYIMQPLSKGSGKFSNTSSKGPAFGSRGSQNGKKHAGPVEPNVQNMFRPDRGNPQSVVSAQKGQYLGDVRQDDMESVESAGSDKMIIRKTTGWSIQYEDNRPPLRHPSSALHENSSRDVVPPQPSA